MQNRALLILFLMLLAMACNKDTATDIFKSAGETQTQNRVIGKFKDLEVWDEFDVVIEQDSQFFVEITYGKNLIPKIETTVIDGKLVLRNDNKFNWARKLGQRIGMVIHCAAIDNYLMNGDASLTNKDTLIGDKVDVNNSGTRGINLVINCDYFTFRGSNIGNIKVAGKCGILSGSMEETSSFDGRNFTSEDTYFWHYSLSDCYLKAEKKLELQLFGRGNAYYTKEPLLSKKITTLGVGKAIADF